MSEVVNEHRDIAFKISPASVDFQIRGMSIVTPSQLAQLKEVMIEDFLWSRTLKSAPGKVQACRTLPSSQAELDRSMSGGAPLR